MQINNGVVSFDGKELNGRPRKYDPAAERKQLKALLELLAARPDHAFIGKGNQKSLNYILWLIKELEIQIRLQVYDRETEVRTKKKRGS